jgi:hypothetical protein
MTSGAIQQGVPTNVCVRWRRAGGGGRRAARRGAAWHLLAARSALGGLGEVPPLPPAPSAADAHHFALSLGFPYSQEASSLEADKVATLLDFFASELQSLRFALALQRREAHKQHLLRFRGQLRVHVARVPAAADGGSSDA